jgi:hypothetical protein
MRVCVDEAWQECAASEVDSGRAFGRRVRGVADARDVAAFDEDGSVHTHWGAGAVEEPSASDPEPALCHRRSREQGRQARRHRLIQAQAWRPSQLRPPTGRRPPKNVEGASAGTLPTDTKLFTGLLVGVVLIVGALTFFPALALGPILDHFQLAAGHLAH